MAANDQILRYLKEFHSIGREIVRFVEPYDEGSFNLRPIAGGWSLAQNMAHLRRSEWMTLLGMQVMRALGSVLPGGRQLPPEEAANLKQAVGERYLKVLERFQDRGTQLEKAGYKTILLPFMPGPFAAEKREIIHEFRQSGLDFETYFLHMDDANAMRLLIPHPSLGMLSQLEMLAFACFHREYHFAKMKAKRLN